MHFNTLGHLRQQMYHCFECGRDALFNVSDVLLSESQARSLPELSLSVFFKFDGIGGGREKGVGV